MALTVTPGGASDDSLVTLATFQAYCDDHGYSLDDYDDTEQEQSARRATAFIEGVGGQTDTLPLRWPGKRASATQRRIWPRSGARFADGVAIDSTTIPAAVQEAVCEAIYYDLTNPGILHATIVPTDVIKSESVSVSGVKVEYRDGLSNLNAARTMLTVVYDLLSDILVPDLKGPHLFMSAVGRTET